MHMKFRAVVAASAALAAGIWAAEQKPATPAPATPAPIQQPAQADEPTRIQVDVTRVSLLFTVTDRKGRFVTNLTKEDFEVIDAKKSQNILDFNAESDLPLRLGILIDTSNSVRDRFKFEQEAAISFINNVIRTNQYKGLVVSFDTRPELISDLIGDTE